MNKTSVLVADDDPNILRLVRVNLEGRDFSVREATSGVQAIAALQQQLSDLVILDLVMPGMTGGEVCAWIRQQGWDIPVIVLSAHDDEQLKVDALDAGADDYITKPFGAPEFMARIRALMRRSTGTQQLPAVEVMQVSGLKVDLKGRRAFVDNEDIHLTRTEFALLAALTRNIDKILSHDELLAMVWGTEYRGSNHYLHIYFGRIRKKLGDKYSSLLETVPGMGYIIHSTSPISS